ncbi:MAG: carboxylesterase/lipase family protein [Sphingomonadaceae bacterium]
MGTKTQVTIGRLAALLAIGWSLVASAATPAQPARASVAQGHLQGVAAADGVQAFLGVPYAQPPVGPLRWAAPQPAPAWPGVRQAQQFGPRPMQRPLYSDMMFRSPSISEDCLYLNIWTPAPAGKAALAGRKLPVLVYFYGGGFQAGDSAEARYDGASMARHGVVSVTVNYRLNVFGFLAHPELTAASPQHASGNYGLMDQAAALQWVQRNIAAFGGDPGRVTIAGESAGSYSVSAQMLSPLARGTFARAIGESGSLLGLAPLPSLAWAEQAGQRFAALAGAADLAALRALPAEQLLAVSGHADAPSFFAIADGHVLPGQPVALYAAGAQARVPLLAGWNSQEGDGAGWFDGAAPSAAGLASAVRRRLGDTPAATAVLQAYQAAAPDPLQAATLLASDQFIGYGTWQWLTLHARSSGQPVYRYYYTQPRPASKAGDIPAARGATHSAEIEYALGNLDLNPVFAWGADDRRAAQLLQGYFLQFIRHGNPNGAGLKHWPALAADGSGQLMQLGAQARLVPAEDAARYQALARSQP